ncbi:eukaryotic translation initiation factor 2-alpha kinase 1 isoform X1 [Clupea harengus]|uniref:Eukaryotic translation initiation factor 2-alpha kinase 1 n=1 Tax=Clupea harengus TaxID=7950 RepID=A0A8M1KL68_CLUHA|nr:eukaryotic translation initiation factor 2-alpha kinase 1 isoform X1 [Clupea harengus]
MVKDDNVHFYVNTSFCGGLNQSIDSMLNQRGKFVNVNSMESSSSNNGRTTANLVFQRNVTTCSRIQETTPLPLTDDDEEDVQFDTSDSENSCEVLLAGKQNTSIQDFTSAIPNHLLLGSLLEHLCLVYERDPTRSRSLFKVIGQKLASMNLLSPLAISDEFSTVRLQHNRAFTELLRAASSSLLPQVGWLNDYKYLGTDAESNLLRTKDDLFQAQTSRYLSEFEEISAVGKGSYGKVFKVTNKLDGQYYAVKKILIRNVTRDDCMKVLREVKVLSSLQHPHIVGYHTAWMEHVQPTTDNSVSKPVLPALERPSLRYPEESSGSSNGSSIVFESSGCPRDSITDDTHTSGSISQRAGPTGGESSKVVFSKVTRNPDHFVPCVYLGQPLPTSGTCPVTGWDGSGLSEEDLSGNRGEMNNNSYIDVDSSHQWAERQPQEVQFHLMLYIQMQLCERSLKDWIQERNSEPKEELTHITGPHRSPDTEQLFHILRKILEGVQYIHSRGIMHRDLKPRNIFLHGHDSHVRIGDFGLACKDIIVDDNDQQLPTSSCNAGSTHTTGVGTFVYAAPEQLEGSRYDSKSDMYSVGVIAVELFQPFGTEMERVHRLGELRQGNVPETLSQKWPVLANYIQLLTSQDPSERPSATQLLESELFSTKDKVKLDLNLT